MAAYDTLESFITSLTDMNRTSVSEPLKILKAELLAARSEEARVRLVHEFIRDVHDHFGGQKKG